ncbi:metalloregulator ArsR/SmtB family transcription factor [Desulfovibrio sp.]|uniref:ArsR/SmtB family transcription factor n=1 Tax=Desulfovibrio sp. TaxID=885 RepID=UPI00257E65FD|nr:metalloregulator ArsR/SmtB family transcription factor [Desulfovibrio sp.]MBR2609653.1 metalloregulator ArsR/SmtB family transcription factor [Desulfovibrio sp.]
MALVYFKALSDETRLRLVHILLHYELSVNELVRILGMGQSRVSRHLKILTEAGLLTSRRDGLWVFYAATRCGEASDFLQAMGPFLHTDTAMREDLAMAAQILEERALKTRQFFNAIAEDWDELNREVLEDFDLPAAVLAAVPEGCRVAVDLGCGTGAVLERLLPASQSLIGVDGSARMLEMCRRRFSPVDLANENRISLRIGELDHLPLRDQEADFACINLVLHHLSDPGEGLREIRRSLTTGGHLFVADFLQHHDETMRSRYGDRWLGFDEERLQERLRQAGFDVLSCTRQAVGRGLFLLLVQARAC